MTKRFEPFAVMLHRRHRRGETIRELALAFDIPEDRVAQRVHAAAIYVERHRIQQDLLALRDKVLGAGRRSSPRK
jgi:hypothetical protein